MEPRKSVRRRTVHAISSARSGAGKTLYARALAAYLAETRRAPFVFDTGAPEGDLAQFAETAAIVVDLTRVEGQMTLFDTLLDADFSDAVIDLGRQAAGLFFSLGAEFGLFGESAPGNLLFVHHFLVDPAERALEQASRVKSLIGKGLLVAVENRHVFDPARERYPDSWWQVEPFATVAIPALPVIGHSLMTRPELGFLAFRRGEWSAGSLVLDHALKRFLDLMFEQFQRLDLRLDVSEAGTLGPGV